MGQISLITVKLRQEQPRSLQLEEGAGQAGMGVGDGPRIPGPDRHKAGADLAAA